MIKFRRVFLLPIILISVARSVVAADQTALPAPGEWDGVTEKAKLERPYEDPIQASIPFPLSSFFLHPWRAYMDTHPASQFLGSMAFNGNNSPEEMDAILQIMSQAGIRGMRIEVGWGNFDWDNHLTGPTRANLIKELQLCKKYGVRPLLLLNSHHAVPCPNRNIPVQFTVAAKKGNRSFKVRPEDVAKIHVNYTGPMADAEYCAAKPLITAIAPDGTCTLSGPLAQDIKAGDYLLHELKFLPLHGIHLQGGNDAEQAASSKATLDGWRGYVQGICDVAVEALDTQNQPDAGFNIEIWNEQTFGSNFLDINNYYDPKLSYTDQVTYEKKRPLGPGIRPDAQTSFKETGPQVLVGIAADLIRSHPEFSKVLVDDGIGNQWPWNGGGNSWPGEDAFSRHYYQGGWTEMAPGKQSHSDFGTMDALGQRDGLHTPQMPDFCRIVVGSNFIPTTRIGLPEWPLCGFQAENIVRDVIPDSRWGGDPLVHGRFTTTGDFHQQQLWETEVNDDRGLFFQNVFKDSKVARDDPRAYVLDSYIAGKMLLRQYLAFNHKGLRNFYIFASAGGAYSLGMFEPPFFTALDAAKGQLTDAVKKEIPAYFQGLGWLTKQMESGEPLASTRALRVDELWEYKPRLVYAGKGTPALPNEWNRDWFAFLPYQLTAGKFIVPYYVMTVDAYKAWQPKRDVLDPLRYQMPDQDFEITIGNCAGEGAKVSAYDPLTNTAIPVTVIPEKSSATKLTVKLSAVDYPRYLLIEEAQPGPLVQNPQVTTDNQGVLHVGWKTNITVDWARLTYGKDWPNRGANEKFVPVANSNTYATDIPTHAKGVLSARILVSAHGLTCNWPRWDEDLQGQVVVPGSVPADVQPLNFNNGIDASTQKSTTAVPLTPDSSIPLPVAKSSVGFGYEIKLPRPLDFVGPVDDQEASLDLTPHGVSLHIRYLRGANHLPLEASLPFVAVGDQVTKTLVKLPSGKVATKVDMTFLPAAHPELQDFAQKQLLVPSGPDDGDLLVLDAHGTPEALQTDDALITSIFASYKPAASAR